MPHPFQQQIARCEAEAIVGTRALGLQVMGVLNITPDSFFDGGRYCALDSALRQAELMAEQGADWIDVGGESTRPGAQSVAEEMELDRVIPVIEALYARIDLPISLDTSKPSVMRAGIAAGVSMINDVRALRVEGAVAAVKDSKVKICLMHMQGEPHSMQSEAQYDDIVREVADFLFDRAQYCIDYGIERERIVLDPGFGFGKTVEHNFRLLHELPQLLTAGYPLMVGWSRKSSLGIVTGRPIEERLAASLAAATLCADRGASIIRVHDVAATLDALNVYCAMKSQANA